MSMDNNTQNSNMENHDEQPKKKSESFFRKVLSNKRFRYGGFSVFLIFAVIAVVILVNVGITAIDDNWNLKADVSANNIYEISPQTSAIIEGLSTPIKFIALFSESNATNTVTELLNRYRALNPQMITVEVVDPVRNPTFANRFDTEGTGITESSVIITNEDESRFRVITSADMYEYDFDLETYESVLKAFIGEQALTNAVVFVSSENQQKVFFLAEHNEVPLSQYSSYVQGPIEQLNIQVEQVGVTGIADLQEGDILIVNSPQRDLSSDERDSLKAFLEQGGKLLYMRNGGDPALENFESLLALYGVTVNHDLVIEADQSKNQMGNPTVIIPIMEDNEITASLTASSLVPVWPYISSFDISPVEQYGRTILPVLTTSDTAYGKIDLETITETFEPTEGDLLGPRTIALTVTQTNVDHQDTKIVALGNSHFISTQDIASYSGNRDLFFNSIRWLQGTSSAVSIVGKSLMGSRINITSTTQLFVLIGICTVVIPLILIIAGLVVWFRRRHL
jgi:hypothetical protein